jgi:hypothetical protein
MSTIDIGTVLNRFDDTIDEASHTVKTFGLRFITEDGRKREISSARKNVKSPKQGLVDRPQGKQLFNLKATGTMLLFDEDNQEPKTVKVACIYGFREYRAKVWYDVSH